MRRTFHAIGQGGFYTEQFNGFNIVYDCGTFSSKTLIIDNIKNTFKKDEIINILFISHFHEDHINQIDFLLDYCNVEKVIIPYMDIESKIMAISDFYYWSNVKFDDQKYLELERLILDPKMYFKEKVNSVVLVNTYVEKINNDHNDHYYYYKNFVNTYNMNSGDRIYINIDNYGRNKSFNDWVFIPYNFKSVSRTKILKKELDKMNIKIDDIENFKKSWNKNKSKLKKIYEKIGKNLNESSLVLYSGPMTTIPWNRKGYNKLVIGKYFSSKIEEVKTKIKSGCLYLGDFDATKNINEIFSSYNKVRNNIGMVQIPHHGSKHNYSENIWKINNNILAVISAGENNKYGHPDKVVLEHLAIRAKTAVITEDEHTKIVFESLNNGHYYY